MPVFWFALSCVSHIDWLRATVVFILIHLFLYPSSNGYNSFMDRDETSIGGIAKPLQPTKQLFYATVLMDALGAVFSFFISPLFAAAFIFYIVCSRLYSYRGIRLKRFPVLGYGIVIINQGALVFMMVSYAASMNFDLNFPWLCVIASSFLIGGFYPITQIYQHEADKKDNVKTISMKLGKRGTFIFCAILYAVAFGLLFEYFVKQNSLRSFFILQLFFLPVIIYFIKWFLKVCRNEDAADFKNTMRMNVIAATCTNLAFITLLILNQLG